MDLLILCRRETCGVRLEELKHYFLFFKACINDTFSNSVELIEENIEETDPVKRGWFIIEYVYHPHNTVIIIETEFRCFSVMISQAEKGAVGLDQLRAFRPDLTEDNIKKAVEILKSELKRPLVFYKRASVNGRMENFVLLGEKEILIPWEDYREMERTGYWKYSMEDQKVEQGTVNAKKEVVSP